MILKSTRGLRAIYNASVDGGKTRSATDHVLACPMQIHVNTPYLLNHALERLLRGRTRRQRYHSFTDYGGGAVATNILRMLQKKRHWII